LPLAISSTCVLNLPILIPINVNQTCRPDAVAENHCRYHRNHIFLPMWQYTLKPIAIIKRQASQPFQSSSGGTST